MGDRQERGGVYAAATSIRPPSDTELSALIATFAELRESVEARVRPELMDEALERIEELEEAANPAARDVWAMAAARNWFVKHAPEMADSVTEVILDPAVRRIVQAGGDALVREYREKFPDAPDIG